MRGSVSALPCDTIGLAPITTRKSVRGTSGTGSDSGEPYSSWLATKRLLMSWDPAVNRWVRQPSMLTINGSHIVCE